MKVDEIVVSQKLPVIITEDVELDAFGYGSVSENITVSRNGGGGGCCCCCCCCCGGASDLEV